MDLDDPAPDFASLARSMGWYAEGPIDSRDDVAAALKRAIAKVKSGQPAFSTPSRSTRAGRPAASETAPEYN